MTIAVAMTFVLTAVACEDTPNTPVRSSADISRDYERRLDEIQVEMKARVVWPLCENPPKPGTCGLVIARLDADQYVRDACGEDPSEKVSDDCAIRFRSDFMKQLPRNYPLARREDVAAFCDSQPDECGSLEAIELQWLTSHNNGVFQELKRRSQDIVAAQEIAQARAARVRRQMAEDEESRRAAMRAIGAGLQAFGNSMSQSSTASRVTLGESANECANDVSCGSGFYCVKGQGELRGSCARVVNRYGNPTFARPRSNSNGPGGKGECQFDTQCPIGFHCIKGNSISGNCLK